MFSSIVLLLGLSSSILGAYTGSKSGTAPGQVVWITTKSHKSSSTGHAAGSGKGSLVLNAIKYPKIKTNPSYPKPAGNIGGTPWGGGTSAGGYGPAAGGVYPGSKVYAPVAAYPKPIGLGMGFFSGGLEYPQGGKGGYSGNGSGYRRMSSGGDGLYAYKGGYM